MSIATTLLDEMDAQQNEVLEQLDQLNERILKLIAAWQTDTLDEGPSVPLVEVPRLDDRAEQPEPNDEAHDAARHAQQAEVLQPEEVGVVEE